jgi:hypothetical protein
VHLPEREAVEEGLRSVGGLAGSAVKQTRDKLRTLVAPSYVIHIVPGEIMLAVGYPTAQPSDSRQLYRRVMLPPPPPKTERDRLIVNLVVNLRSSGLRCALTRCHHRAPPPPPPPRRRRRSR